MSGHSTLEASLEVTAGPAEGSRLELAGEELRLGRNETGVGNLGEDPELSRRHALVRRLAGGALQIEDLGSTNGTFVNGVRISGTQSLRTGDEIALGATVLRVAAAEAPPADAPAAALPDAGASARRPALRVVAGWAPGALIPVGDDPVTIGTQAAGASALGDDPGIGERHLTVSPLASARLLVEDLGSEGGTLIGGTSIGAPTILEKGDRLVIGRSTLEVVEVAGSVRDEPVRVVGGVSRVPEGLFALIATRAPVRREEVMRVFLLSLGWAFAANLLVRTAALETFDVPEDLRALQFPGFFFASLMPVAANAFGFYKTFRRPDDSSVKKYLAPTFGVPFLIVVLNLAIINHGGALEVLITVLVTALPVGISVPLMLRLRERVARERVDALRGAATSD